MQEALKRLGDRCGEFAAVLDGGQVLGGDAVIAKRYREQPRRSHGILDGHVYADTAGRGHGVCGITDAQQPVRVPAPQPVEPYVEQLDVVHRFEA